MSASGKKMSGFEGCKCDVMGQMNEWFWHRQDCKLSSTDVTSLDRPLRTNRMRRGTMKSCLWFR